MKKAATRKKAATKKKAAAKKKTTTKKKATAKKKSASAVDAAQVYMKSIFMDPETSHRRAMQALCDHGDEIRKIHGVVDVEVGVKLIGGESARMFALRVLVKHKCQSYSEIKKKKTKEIKPSYDGVPTDIVEICEHEASVDPGDDIFAQSRRGTLGGYVRLAFPPREVRFLTAGHVISNSAGNTKVSVKDKDKDKVIGAITPSPENFELARYVDCALVTPKTDDMPPLSNGKHTVIRVGAASSADLLHDGLIWKVGANDDTEPKFTLGTLTSLSSGERTVKLGNGKKMKVSGQLVIRPKDGNSFGEKGDSGAIVSIGEVAIGVLRSVGKDQAGKQEALATPFTEIFARTEFPLFNF